MAACSRRPFYTIIFFLFLAACEPVAAEGVFQFIDVPEGFEVFKLTAVSDDGSTVVGSYAYYLPYCSGTGPYGYDGIWISRAFRMKNGVFEALDLLPDAECIPEGLLNGSPVSTVAQCVSSDGEFVAGYAGNILFSHSNGNESFYDIARRAVTWDGGIGPLAGSDFDAPDDFAADMTEDGVSILGFIGLEDYQSYRYDLVRWIGGSMQNLNVPLDPNNVRYAYKGISGNGEYIFADSLIWNADNGWQTLNQIVTTAGIEAPAEKLDKIDYMSYDGNVIIGHTNDRTYETWRIILDACPNLETGEGTAQWLTSSSGDFSDPANWLDNAVPGATKTVLLNDDGLYTINIDGYFTNQALVNELADISLELEGNTYNLTASYECGPALINGRDDTEPVSMVVQNGTMNLGGDMLCYGGPESFFTLTDQAELTVEGRVFIDAPEPMRFLIEQGSTFSGNSSITVGDETGYKGSLEINGGTSQLNGSLVTVGDAGVGILTIDTSSLATIEILSIGEKNGGQGLVNVLNGATVTVDILTMANEAGSFGDLAISGESTDFINAAAQIGINDSAKVSVTGGASVGGTDTTSWELGVNDGSSGDFLLSGIGSEARLEKLYVGLNGLGDLQVLDGARVANGPNPMGQIVVGGGATGAGSVNVSGNNAQLITDFMIAGLDGTAIVSCSDDAYIQANGMYIGPLGNVSSNVLVIEGFGSKNGLRAGSGIAVETLTVADGAALDVNTVTLGQGGTIAGSGDLAIDLLNDGTISPGDSLGHLAEFTVTGNYTQTMNGALQIELGENDSDRLAVGGIMDLDGTLEIALAHGASPKAGDEFIIASGTAVSGSFADIVKPSGIDLAVDYPGGNSVRVVIQNTTDIAIEETDGNLPSRFSLSQNYPNPFNPSTRIDFAIPDRCEVNLTVYDMLGRTVIELIDKPMGAGNYTMTRDGRNNAGETISSGIYLYRLRAGADEAVNKMILMK